MPFAASQIAQSIVDQLAPAMPEPAHVTITAAGSALCIADGRTSTQVRLSAFGGQGETLSAQEAETATRAALSTIQDAVAESLTLPWPALDALPDAAVSNGILSAWFGSQGAPALRLDGIARASPAADP